jgi:hypothetical protein
MSDQFTEVTSKSWGNRIMESIQGIIFGFLFIIGALILLWWNEGRAIHNENDLKDGSKNVVHLQTNVPIPENENKLVHITGKVETKDTLRDTDFNIHTNAIALKRNVLVYQWKEESTQKTEKETGGSEKTTTTYNYVKDWVSSKINSDDFKNKEGHINKCAYSFQNNSLTAQNVVIDSFNLSPELVQQINNYEIFKLDSIGSKNAYKISSNVIYLGSGKLENEPAIGDMKISYEVIYPNQLVSIISKQSNKTLVPFVGKNGSTISELMFGAISANEMFKVAISNNSTLTWVLRLAGLIICIMGLKIILKPMVIIGDVVPFIGSILNIGTGLVSIMLGFVLSFITIAIAWFFYRPITSVILILIVATLLFFLMKKRKAVKI